MGSSKANAGILSAPSVVAAGADCELGVAGLMHACLEEAKIRNC
jgi:hypothetical protein